MSSFPNGIPGSHAEFLARIQMVRESDNVSVDSVILEAGPSAVRVRRQGGYVTRLALTGPRGNLAEVLYCEEDQTVPGLRASHAMLPVGQNRGPGGPHGYLRWVPHHIAGREKTENAASVDLSPAVPSDVTPVSRQITLAEDHATFRLKLTNWLPSSYTSEHVATSIGEQLYFNAPGPAREARVNGRTLDQLVGKGAADEVDYSRAQFWWGFNGRADIDLPDGPGVRLESSVLVDGGTTFSVASGLGMLVWRPEGSASMVFAPTIGLGVDGSNDGLRIPPGATAVFATTLSLR